MTPAPIEIPETQIGELCRRNGVRRLAVFGSVFSGRPSDSVDIGVLVQFRSEALVGFFRLADIEKELSGSPGGRSVDLRPPMDLSPYFRDGVVCDAHGRASPPSDHPTSTSEEWLEHSSAPVRRMSSQLYSSATRRIDDALRKGALSQFPFVNRPSASREQRSRDLACFQISRPLAQGSLRAQL